MLTGEMLGALALMIPIVALMIPIVGILTSLQRDGIKRAERTDARKLYERLALEKLDVMKTAVAMGYAADDLAALDKRLERLIGAEELKALLEMQPLGIPTGPTDLRQADLLHEMESLKHDQTKRAEQG